MLEPDVDFWRCLIDVGTREIGIMRNIVARADNAAS
jgi:hypothetical protein